LGRLALTLLLVLGFSLPASADCEVGKRIFVAQLILEDPCNDDELLLASPSVFRLGIPVNSSDGLGVIAGLHLHTETLFPKTLGMAPRIQRTEWRKGVPSVGAD